MWQFSSFIWVIRKPISFCYWDVCMLGWGQRLLEMAAYKWKWLLDLVKGIPTNNAYHFLTVVDTPCNSLHSGIWHRKVTLKVSLFFWQLLRNRLSRNDKLIRRGIIDPDQNCCVNWSSMDKLAKHPLLCCNHFSSLWAFIQNWIGISSLDFSCILNHVLQFGQIGGSSKYI